MAATRNMASKKSRITLPCVITSRRSARPQQCLFPKAMSVVLGSDKRFIHFLISALLTYRQNHVTFARPFRPAANAWEMALILNGRNDRRTSSIFFSFFLWVIYFLFVFFSFPTSFFSFNISISLNLETHVPSPPSSSLLTPSTITGRDTIRPVWLSSQCKNYFPICNKNVN